MHREDDSRFLLFIEPDKSLKSLEPIYDPIVKCVEYALERAKKGTSNYSSPDKEPHFTESNGFRGVHYTLCGEKSSNQDYLLENGMITNSLAPFYLKWYRNAIPNSELKKIDELLDYYGQKQ